MCGFCRDDKIIGAGRDEKTGFGRDGDFGTTTGAGALNTGTAYGTGF